MDPDDQPVTGKFDSLKMRTDLFCATYDESGICYTGGANGYIYAWNSTGKNIKNVRSHKGVIFSILFHIPGGKLLSGGIDEKLIKYSLPDLKIESELKFTSGVIAIDYKKEPERILVGLIDGSIIQVIVDQENYYQILLQGHHDGGIYALDLFEEGMVTAGEDNKINILELY